MSSDIALFISERVEVNRTAGGTVFVRGELTGLADVKLKRADNPAIVINGVEILNQQGFYKFTGFDQNKNWKLYVSGVERATYGADNGRWEGTDNLLDLTVLKNPSAIQNVYGQIQFYGDYQGMAVPLQNPIPSGGVPEFNNSLAWKSWIVAYVQEQINLIQIQAYQYAPQVIEVFSGASQVTGKVYSSMKLASDYAYNQTPSENKRYCLWVKASGMSSRYIPAISGTMRNFIDWVSMNYGIDIVSSDASLTADMHIHNASVYYGANDVITDREFTKVKYHNCRIHHYKDLTITNGMLDRCTVISGAGKKCLIKGSGGLWSDVERTMFNVMPEIVGGADNYGGVLDYAVNSSYVVPPDPTIPV